MSAEAVEHQLATILGESFPWTKTTPLSPATRLKGDLQLDSLHLVDLQCSVEEAFEIEFDPADDGFLGAFGDFGGLSSYVRYLQERRLL